MTVTRVAAASRRTRPSITPSAASCVLASRPSPPPAAPRVASAPSSPPGSAGTSSPSLAAPS
eukprot:31135-Pelagococcus_subviridis.AAC.24